MPTKMTTYMEAVKIAEFYGFYIQGWKPGAIKYYHVVDSHTNLDVSEAMTIMETLCWLKGYGKAKER